MSDKGKGGKKAPKHSRKEVRALKNATKAQKSPLMQKDSNPRGSSPFAIPPFMIY